MCKRAPWMRCFKGARLTDADLLQSGIWCRRPCIRHDQESRLGRRLVAPRSAPRHRGSGTDAGWSRLCPVHHPLYVGALRSGEPRPLAESQGFAWDPCLRQSVCASTGGMIAAVRAARIDGVSGSLSTGLHHARRSRGKGYCSVSGLAIAADIALAEGASSVIIIDVDAHCGGGTAELVRDHPRIWHLDVAVDTYDHYDPWPRGMLTVVGSADRYIESVTTGLSWLERAAPSPTLCIYNAGMIPP